jgi:hypothetical protein
MLELLTPQQTAEQLHVAPATLAGWRVRRSGPPFVRLGRKVLYDSRDVTAWLNSRRVETNDADREKMEQVAHPFLGARQRIPLHNRPTRHLTVRERREGQRSRTPPRHPGRNDAPPGSESGMLQ